MWGGKMLVAFHYPEMYMSGGVRIDVDGNICEATIDDFLEKIRPEIEQIQE